MSSSKAAARPRHANWWANYLRTSILDTGGRAATTTFTQRQIGDVLVTFEK
jgi:ABC-type sulfate transport system substrate-binding protein